jgi:hypothetical protein
MSRRRGGRCRKTARVRTEASSHHRAGADAGAAARRQPRWPYHRPGRWAGDRFRSVSDPRADGRVLDAQTAERSKVRGPSRSTPTTSTSSGTRRRASASAGAELGEAIGAIGATARTERPPVRPGLEPPRMRRSRAGSFRHSPTAATRASRPSAPRSRESTSVSAADIAPGSHGRAGGERAASGQPTPAYPSAAASLR